MFFDLISPGSSSWMDAALCAGSKHADAWFATTDKDSAHAAEVCSRCPVREQCLDYAIECGIEEGVWGGLGPKERRSIARKRRRA